MNARPSWSAWSCCCRFIRERHETVFTAAALALLHTLPNAKQYEVFDVDHKLDLGALIEDWPELNFALFWHTIEAARQKAEKKGERVVDWWTVQIWPPFVGFTATDFDGALDCVSSRTAPDDRLVALSLAFQLYVEQGRPAALRHRLKLASRSEPALIERIQTLLHVPPPSAQIAELRRMQTGWKRRSKARAERVAKNREAWRQHLIVNVDKIRDSGLGPEAVSQAQHYLHNEMRRTKKPPLQPA